MKHTGGLNVGALLAYEGRKWLTSDFIRFYTDYGIVIKIEDDNFFTVFWFATNDKYADGIALQHINLINDGTYELLVN